MPAHHYPDVRTSRTEDIDDNPTAELQEDYDLSDPDRSKIVPLKSAKERYEFFDKVAANEIDSKSK